MSIWLEKNNVTRKKSAAYKSQSNELAERGVKRCKKVIKKCLDEGKDWRTGIPEMRSQPSSVLDGASSAEVFNGGRRPRSTILPHFDPPKKVDVDRIMVFRSVIHENQAAKMNSKNLASEPLQVGPSVLIQKQEKLTHGLGWVRYHP